MKFLVGFLERVNPDDDNRPPALILRSRGPHTFLSRKSPPLARKSRYWFFQLSFFRHAGRLRLSANIHGTGFRQVFFAMPDSTGSSQAARQKTGPPESTKPSCQVSCPGDAFQQRSTIEGLFRRRFLSLRARPLTFHAFQKHGLPSRCHGDSSVDFGASPSDCYRCYDSRILQPMKGAGSLPPSDPNSTYAEHRPAIQGIFLGLFGRLRWSPRRAKPFFSRA